jgi:Serine/threonine protein phosphatase
VTCVPYVSRTEIDGPGIIVMASDGLWDVVTDEVKEICKN